MQVAAVLAFIAQLRSAIDSLQIYLLKALRYFMQANHWQSLVE